jgi:FkbM family methyltransferase
VSDGVEAVMNSVAEYLSNREDALEKIRSGESFYLQGCTPYAEKLISVLPRRISGIVDIHASTGSFGGTKVVSLDDISKDSVIVSCVVDAHPVTALKALIRDGFYSIIDYYWLCFQTNMDLHIPWIKDSDVENIDSNITRAHAVFNMFADPRSKTEWDAVLSFRHSLDVKNMYGLPCRLAEQYFDPTIPLPVHCGYGAFIDGGGYDGTTSLEYAAKYPDYSSIYCFEPSRCSAKKTEQALADTSNAYVLRKGLSDRKGEVCFDSSLGPASSISEAGTEKIQLTSIDEEISGQVFFIKLDIEGEELSAIEGALATIKRWHPVLAICVYHKIEHFWQIPEKILSVDNTYKVYFRHYTEGILESVMYFI